MTLLPLPAWEWLLRASIAVAFIYPPIAALFDPYSWVGYFPAFLTAIVSPHELLLLHAFGALEIVLALLILFRPRPWLSLGIAGAILVAIVIATPAQFPVLFRDLSIALAAFSLAVYYRLKLTH